MMYFSCGNLVCLYKNSNYEICCVAFSKKKSLSNGMKTDVQYIETASCWKIGSHY